MGAAVDWQAQVIEELGNLKRMVIYNPRRVEFSPDTLDEQIEWELDALAKCDLVFMWLPGDSKAPISLLETGLYMNSGKLLLGAEPEFYRRRNLELTGRRYGVPVMRRLDIMLSNLNIRYSSWFIANLRLD